MYNMRRGDNMLVRENYLARIRGFYNSDLIKILVGIRRCGKSVILNQIVDELKEKNKVDDEHIIFINFEFIEFEDLLDYKKLNTYIKDRIKDNKMYYLFLDEVQNVDNFERVVNSLRASIKNISIFLTGSNSKMLSDELSSVLSGRYVLFNINPLSYKEFVQLTDKNGQDLDTFWDYAKWGGLPNRCEFINEIDIKNYLHSVYDSIILRDVVKRFNLKDTVLFDMILQYLIETAGREFSAENVIKYLMNDMSESPINPVPILLVTGAGNEEHQHVEHFIQAFAGHKPHVERIALHILCIVADRHIEAPFEHGCDFGERCVAECQIAIFPSQNLLCIHLGKIYFIVGR